MKELLAILVLGVIYSVGLALLIENAMLAFKSEKYFIFGLWLIPVICMVKMIL